MGLKPTIRSRINKLYRQQIVKQANEALKNTTESPDTKVNRLRRKLNKKRKWTNGKIVKIVSKFCEALSGKVFFIYQEKFIRKIIDSLLENDGATLTGLFSRQSGKTEAVAEVCSACAIILPTLANQPIFKNDPRFNRYWTDEFGVQRYSGFKDGMLIGIYAPVDDQAKLAFNRIKGMLTSNRGLEILEDVDFQLNFDTFNGQNIVMRNNIFSSMIGAYTASEGAQIEGKTWHLIICDESQDISDYKMLKSIEPMLAFNNGTMVQIGTPGLHKGVFHRNIKANRKLLTEHGIQNHFQYDYHIVQKYNPQYKNYVAQQITKYGGIDNDEFRMNFLLEWLEDRGMFIGEGQLRACGKDYDIFEASIGNFTVGAIDWAKKIDSSVLTVMDVDKSNADPMGRALKKIIAWEEFSGVSYQSQVNEIIERIYQFNINLIVSDETGVGQVATELLQANAPSFCTVLAVNLSGKQKNTDLWSKLAIEMTGGRLFFPYSKSAQQDYRCQRFVQQFMDLEKDTSKGYIDCHAPDGKGYHDDYCDSLALANFGADFDDDEIVDIDCASDAFSDTVFHKA